LMGPGPRFELGRKAPQASMLPSYTTPATFQWKMCTLVAFRYFRPRSLGFVTEISNALFSLSEDFATIVVPFNKILKSYSYQQDPLIEKLPKNSSFS
jgi:hypothetical protein